MSGGERAANSQAIVDREFIAGIPWRRGRIVTGGLECECAQGTVIAKHPAYRVDPVRLDNAALYDHCYPANRGVVWARPGAALLTPKPSSSDPRWRARVSVSFQPALERHIRGCAVGALARVADRRVFVAAKFQESARDKSRLPAG